MNNYLDDRKAKVEAYLKKISAKRIWNRLRLIIPEGLFIKLWSNVLNIIYLEDLVNN